MSPGSVNPLARLNKLAFFFMSYYLAQALYQSYISVYYTNIGLSASEIGIISACVAIISMMMQPIWGTIGDRAFSRNRLLYGLCLCSGCFVLTFLFTDSFPALLALGCLFAAFYTSIQPTGDAIALEALRQQNKPFGPIRLTGGIVFAVSSVLFGQLLNHSGTYPLIVFGISLMCFVTYGVSHFLPHSSGRTADRRQLSFFALLRDRNLVLLLAFMAPLMVSMGYFYTFFSPYFLTLPEGNASLLGWCYFISACSEMPFLLLSDRLFRRLGAGRLLCISGLALSIRWAILASTQALIPVMLSQLLHGWAFIVITVSTSMYVDRAIPNQLKSSGQMLLSIVSFGFARTVGNFLGGYMVQISGYQQVFSGCALLCACALLVFFPIFLRKRPLNGCT